MIEKVNSRQNMFMMALMLLMDRVVAISSYSTEI